LFCGISLRQCSSKWERNCYYSLAINIRLGEELLINKTYSFLQSGYRRKDNCIIYNVLLISETKSHFKEILNSRMYQSTIKSLNTKVDCNNDDGK
jgi:hypothetical protein